MVKHSTDIAWERWGKEDPYFGVLADQKYRKNNLENTKSDFFESGDRHITDIIEEIEKHFGTIPKENALDFGCGVGRLLAPLSKIFHRVVGLDISRSMLEEASKNLVERKIDNVELLESDDVLSALGQQTFDFIHTFVVLQHIVPKRGYVIIQNLLRHLSPDGTFLLHVSIQHRASLARKVVTLARRKIPFAWVFSNIVRRRTILEPVMEMYQYDVCTIMNILKLAGFVTLISKLEDHGRYLTVSFYSKRQNAATKIAGVPFNGQP